MRKGPGINLALLVFMAKTNPRKYVELATKPKYWYLVANRVGAVFYTDGEGGKFRFVKRLENDRAHLREKQTEHVRHEADARKFAHEIAAELAEAGRLKSFDALVLAAEPHFLGILREALDDETLRKVRYEVPSDYARGSDKEVRAHIMKSIGGNP
jgi:hypothetical protein